MRPLASLMIVLVAAGCDGGTPKDGPGPTDPAVKHKPAPAGWVKHTDPVGFAVAHPEGWTTSHRDDGLITVQSAEKTARVFVQPFLLSKKTPAQTWLGEMPARFKTVFPEAEIDGTRRHKKRPDEVFASLRFKGGRASVLVSIEGRSGMLYAIAAPEEQFEQQRPALVQVLNSFQFVEPAASHRKTPSGPQVAWVKWKDPLQNAFLLDVPKGWAVKGGMVHRNAVDPRSCIYTESKDKKVRISGGDAQVPSFTLPTQMLTRTGFREGGMYSPGYGVTMQVMRYIAGAHFAKWYVQSKLPKEFSGLKFTAARDQKDVVKAFNQIYARHRALGVNMRLDAGDVAFTCKRQGKEWRGYYFATTQLTTTAYAQGGQWQFTALYGYLAEAGKEKLAQALLSHMVKSFRLNPQWVAKQQKLTAKVSDIVTETHNHISKTIDDTYWGRQKVMDNLSRKWSNTILGQTDVIDPETGEKWKVSNNSNYYWRKQHTDEIAGTRVYDRPDTDFTPLKEW